MAYLKPQYDRDGQLHLTPPPAHHGLTIGDVAFSALIGFLPRPIRRWWFTMVLLTFAVCYTAQSPHEWWTPESGVPYGEGGVFLGYKFPWYCIAMIVVWCFWFVFGNMRARRLTRQLQAVGDTPVQHLKRRMSGRVLIGVDTTPRPPQGPTGASRGPVAPSPAPRPPSSPMGSNLPVMWAPTYSGPKRIETGLSGIIIRDYRGVDPEDL